MDLIIIGAGGHGKVVANVAYNSQKYKNIYFLDDNKEIDSIIFGFNVINKIDFEFIKYKNNSQVEFFIAMGDCQKRYEIQHSLFENNINLATLIDPFSSIPKNCKIGIGSIICPGGILGPDSIIGKGVIINNSATIDHDSYVGDYVHVCPHASLSGSVQIGNKSTIGTGARVIQNKKVGFNCFIGAGAVVTTDIPDAKKAVGIPAKVIEDN